ncbi:hypothetical protein [Sphingomonas aerophila]|jgi:hypothetical protein|uniref:Uncharacterized protein n=1 Tax=Sphingomonas aerophila TaxID=1344948 RepID=A0A7W9BAY7_9SPHN|nr:hypothetical protein [Sphingomonas aerophila]MBB5713838.1 hypothetical protein [Sphingomonas aerophila]
MERRSTRRAVLLLITVLACCLTVRSPLMPTRDWYFSVEVAQVRVSVGMAAAPVRNRTVLFNTGQVIAALGLAQ